jgi:spermidine synthase
MLGCFALTLFCSALLLFLVQPLIGKMILPLLGGTPAVWNTCMVFFQALLLAGYAYAHATTAWLGARKQAWLHLAVLVVPFLFFPVAVNKALVNPGAENPIPGLLLVLFVSVGVPFFVVSTSAPLLQKWFASTDHPAAKDPYFLYGASNLGSMLALIGYPFVVEPRLVLQTQAWAWTIGYGLLVVLAATCAVFLWRSRPALVLAPADTTVAANVPETAIRKNLVPVGTSRAVAQERNRSKGRGRSHHVTTGPASLSPEEPPPTLLSDKVTPGRRLRWVLLAAVPSSLMLGATTYVTTDIAAIPLLWVVPLTLYLLTFIIVFAKIPELVQRIVVFGAAATALAAFAFYFLPNLHLGRPVLYVLEVAAVGALAACALVFWDRKPNLLHRAMVLILPLLVLLLLFMMLSNIKPDNIVYAVAMHLIALFVVAMVCHGELALDRPGTKYLTEFFLWMSVGGVLGGLVNALIAPMVFNDLYEYQLALMAVCFLLPPLGLEKDTRWGRYADAIMAVVLTIAGVVLFWLGAKAPINDLSWEKFTQVRWGFHLAALLIASGAVALVAWLAREKRSAGWFDLLLPLSLFVLVVGLSFGLYAEGVNERLEGLAALAGLKLSHLRLILNFGLPAVLCYTFVERSRRFGLGVGALLLGASFCNLFEAGVVYQTRSFFGVLKVSQGFDPEDTNWNGDYFIRLTHGTTLHGKQFQDPARKEEPITYYHRTGPVGQFCEAYNRDPSRPLGVIGLGTGTMACYALPGQRLTFYDIDAAVRDISYTTDRYFTFVADARKRGAEIDLVLGDARVTMERQNLADNEKYGLLVVDAFSSDAIPIHLITREALRIYLDKLRPDGIVAFHISNRYLKLEPVLANLAKAEGLTALIQHDDRRGYLGKTASTWVVIARQPEHLSRLMQRQEQWRDLGQAAQSLVLNGLYKEMPVPWKPVEVDEKVGVWTDDYSNLWSVFGPGQ